MLWWVCGCVVVVLGVWKGCMCACACVRIWWWRCGCERFDSNPCHCLGYVTQRCALSHYRMFVPDGLRVGVDADAPVPADGARWNAYDSLALRHVLRCVLFVFVWLVVDICVLWVGWIGRDPINQRSTDSIKPPAASRKSICPIPSAHNPVIYLRHHRVGPDHHAVA